jgi:hypothetical protein
MFGWEGVGVLTPVGDYILQEFNTLYLTRFRAKLLDHPKQKARRGGGLRQINTCRKVPLQGKFFQITTFCLAFYPSNLSTGGSKGWEGGMLPKDWCRLV